MALVSGAQPPPDDELQGNQPLPSTDLAMVLGKSPEQRLKWLQKILPHLSAGRISTLLVYDIVAHRRFGTGVGQSIGRQMRELLMTAIESFSSKQQRFLKSSQCKLNDFTGDVEPAPLPPQAEPPVPPPMMTTPALAPPVSAPPPPPQQPPPPPPASGVRPASSGVRITFNSSAASGVGGETSDVTKSSSSTTVAASVDRLPQEEKGGTWAAQTLQWVKEQQESRASNGIASQSGSTGIENLASSDTSGALGCNTSATAAQPYDPEEQNGANDPSDLRNFLEELGLGRYIPNLEGQGLSTADDIRGMSKAELVNLGILRGHVKLLQQTLAHRPRTKPLVAASVHPYAPRQDLPKAFAPPSSVQEVSYAPVKIAFANQAPAVNAQPVAQIFEAAPTQPAKKGPFGKPATGAVSSVIAGVLAGAAMAAQQSRGAVDMQNKNKAAARQALQQQKAESDAKAKAEAEALAKKKAEAKAAALADAAVAGVTAAAPGNDSNALVSSPLESEPAPRDVLRDPDGSGAIPAVPVRREPLLPSLQGPTTNSTASRNLITPRGRSPRSRDRRDYREKDSRDRDRRKSRSRDRDRDRRKKSSSSDDSSKSRSRSPPPPKKAAGFSSSGISRGGGWDNQSNLQKQGSSSGVTEAMLREAQMKAAQKLGAVPSQSPLAYKPGDWYCPLCGAQNYKGKLKCYRCIGQKPVG